MTSATNSLTKSAFSALRWNYLGYIMRSASNFASGIVLARLLDPQAFGQVAAASLVFGVGNQLADAGFTSALVQAPELKDADIRFAFTVQLAIAAVMTTGCILAAPYVSKAFHDPAIQTVLRAIAPLFLLQSIGQTSTALLRRRLDFRAVQTAQVSSYLFGYLFVGVPAALYGAGVWSLVAAQLSQTLFYSAQVYARARHSIVPCVTLPGTRLLRFGFKITCGNVVNWSISNLDNAFVGSVFGSANLGLYSRAFNLASAPSDGIVSTCQQVLFASCSRTSGRLEPIRRAYLASVAAIAMIMLPPFWSMAACAPTVILALYGQNWGAASALFRPLVLAVTLNALMALAGPILAATDHVDRDLRAQILSLLCAAVAFTVSARYSPIALAWAVLLAYGFRYYIVTAPTLQLLSLKWSDLLRVARGPLFVSLIMSCLLFVSDSVATRWALEPLFRLCLLALVGTGAWCLLICFAAHRLLPPELVHFLTHASLGLPRKLSQALDRIAALQKSRLEQHARPWTPRRDLDCSPDVYVATLMTQTGETGVHTHFNTFCQYLQGHNIRVEVLTPYETPLVLRGAAKVMACAVDIVNGDLGLYVRQYLSQMLLQYRMRQRLPRGRPWTVYAQCPRSSMAALGCRTRGGQSVVIVVHFNRSQADEMAERGWIERGGWVYRRTLGAERRALLSVDRIVYCSEFMRSHLQSAVEGLRQRSSVVLPNFVTSPSPASGPTGDIITIGTLEPRKNQAFILQVLAEAKKRGKRYSLTVVGRGEMDAALRQLALDLGVADQVTFAGFVPNAARLLHRYRVYAHAATIESFGIVLIEALSVGLPILAPAVGGIPEIIDHQVEGFFWDTSNPEVSADMLIRLLENEELRRSLSSAARRKYVSHFRVDRVAPKLCRFVLGSAPATSG